MSSECSVVLQTGQNLIWKWEKLEHPEGDQEDERSRNQVEKCTTRTATGLLLKYTMMTARIHAMSPQT